MKTKLTLLALVSAFSLQPLALFAQGSLTPPGAPVATMKSLDQIEARTPISSVPFVITNSGSYYLTGNLSDSLVITHINPIIFGGSLANTNAITIAASGVTLDLNGFTINCTHGSTGAGISLNGGLSDITIVNGHIRGGVTNSAAGVFGGYGFAYGIYSPGNSYNVRVKGVSVAGVLDDGINLGMGNSTVVEACAVNMAGSIGIDADSVADSTAMNCGSTGIFAGTAQNCKGSAVGSGVGLHVTTANNCYGYSSGSGTGLYASSVATGCYGFSSSGTGLDAVTANNCHGYSNGSGTGLNAYSVATGCYGLSVSGTGLDAFIASVCHGTTSSGTTLSTSHNVNSY